MLYDYDALDKDDEIGEAKLAVADLKNQEEKDVWLNIEEMTPGGPSQHKVSLVCSLWCGVLRAFTFSLLHSMQHDEQDRQENSCLTVPAFGQVLLQCRAGASHRDWNWEVQTCSLRPQTVGYHSCCNLSDWQ